MKKILLTISGLFTVIATVMAQDCKTFLQMTSNAQVTMSIYDKKGKLSGEQTWKVQEVKKEGNDIVSTIVTSFKDEKGKEIANSSGTYRCNGGVLQADMRMSMPQQQLNGMKASEVKMTNSYLEYPYTMNVGQSLKDAELNMDMDMNGGMKAKAHFKEVNRKVEGKESITTPAGTWEAYIITYDGTMRTQMAGIGIPFNFTVKEWFVPGIGVVKSETYSKGKLAGSTMVTAIVK